MVLKIVNEYGTITIDNEVVARIAGIAATECCIVGMGAKNVKDGFVQLLKKESLSKGIRLEVLEDSVIIDLHIIVEYGTNISAIADSLISSVQYKVEEYAGVKVKKINIFVDSVRVDN